MSNYNPQFIGNAPHWNDGEIVTADELNTILDALVQSSDNSNEWLYWLEQHGIPEAVAEITTGDIEAFIREEVQSELATILAASERKTNDFVPGVNLAIVIDFTTHADATGYASLPALNKLTAYAHGNLAATYSNFGGMAYKWYSTDNITTLNPTQRTTELSRLQSAAESYFPDDVVLVFEDELTALDDTYWKNYIYAYGYKETRIGNPRSKVAAERFEDGLFCIRPTNDSQLISTIMASNIDEFCACIIDSETFLTNYDTIMDAVSEYGINLMTLSDLVLAHRASVHFGKTMSSDHFTLGAKGDSHNVYDPDHTYMHSAYTNYREDDIALVSRDIVLTTVAVAGNKLTITIGDDVYEYQPTFPDTKDTVGTELCASSDTTMYPVVVSSYGTVGSYGTSKVVNSVKFNQDTGSIKCNTFDVPVVKAWNSETGALSLGIL